MADPHPERRCRSATLAFRWHSPSSSGVYRQWSNTVPGVAGVFILVAKLPRGDASQDIFIRVYSPLMLRGITAAKPAHWSLIILVLVIVPQIPLKAVNPKRRDTSLSITELRRRVLRDPQIYDRPDPFPNTAPPSLERNGQGPENLVFILLVTGETS